MPEGLSSPSTDTRDHNDSNAKLIEAANNYLQIVIPFLPNEGSFDIPFRNTDRFQYSAEMCDATPEDPAKLTITVVSDLGVEQFIDLGIDGEVDDFKSECLDKYGEMKPMEPKSKLYRQMEYFNALREISQRLESLQG